MKLSVTTGRAKRSLAYKCGIGVPSLCRRWDAARVFLYRITSGGICMDNARVGVPIRCMI
eukprot:14545-Eustigmatos_ZCMA.PRE.1